MKRVIALLLCVLTISSVFFGCKKEEVGDNTQSAQTQEEQLKYTYDAVFNSANESVKNNYQDVCNAIVNREENFRISMEVFQDVVSLLYTSFPLVDLVDKFSPNPDNSGVTIVYKYEKDEHTKFVNDFNNSVKAILKECKFGEVTTGEYVLNVYKYISANAKKSEDASIKLYDTIIKGEGTSFTYSKMFAYLIQQADIEAYQIVAFDNKLATCSLVLLKLGDSYFYCDPYRENIDNAGAKLKYFGMTTDYVNEIGISKLQHTNYDEVSIAAQDTKFEKCKDASTYVVDNGVLEITDESANVYKIVL